jgi:thioredoxin 1
MLKKNIILISFSVLVMLCSFVLPQSKKAVANKGGIVFFKGTWKEALQKAKAENKKIFLEIGASWCGPCKKLKAKTFTNAKVGAYFNANFINVTLDGEDGADGTMLTEKYKLAYFPSLYIIDSTSKVLKAGVGFYNSKEILQFAKSIK